MPQLDKTYDPAAVEDQIYQRWLDNDYFHAVADPHKQPYSMVIPPPNITGQLHMGHAMNSTLQDIIIRVKRMQGYSALWLPGTDHASIATEVRIVEAMQREGITKEDIGREAFLERAWKWNARFGGRIIEQLKKLGSSCDWKRLRFTMDEGLSRAVTEVFVKYYEKGLIYRGERIINWCPDCRTGISDAEVDYTEKDGSFWNIRYPFLDGSGYLVVATTRPETMLGDTAVAVNPNDERYRQHIGKTIVLPLMNREIPVIADDYVEMDFGTGVVKITPAHDPNDFDVAKRHNIPAINVMDEDAVINDNGGVYAGLSRDEARERVVADLQKAGFLDSVEPHVHNVGSCYRCNTIVEPRLSMQWFVRMEPLAGPAIDAVEDGSVRFVPERFSKIYFNWMNNIRDWNISRQLWWGHRIPAYYCETCGNLIVSATAPEKCERCEGTLHQDEDTLDTWFSSALWPFSTLGWPDDTEDFRYFYPTNTLITAYDIIFFWVARMIFSGIENTGKPPFSNVLLHGLVRAADGQKMSKSLNNGIDPLDVIEQFGADALRFTLVSGNSPGNDTRYSEERIRASRNFSNKIWNAARFILMQDVSDVPAEQLPDELELADRWLVHGINRLTAEVTENIEHFELGVAAAKIYEEIWDVFCDWYIEISKIRLNADHPQERQNCKQVLVWGMTKLLKLLHPIMPFITEEIYLALPHRDESIMISAYPTYDPALEFEQDALDFQMLMDVIKAVRVVRADMQVPPNKKISLFVETEKREDEWIKGIPLICRLAGADQVEIGRSFDIPGAVQTVTNMARVLIPMEELVDKEKERERLTKEQGTVQKEMDTLRGRLSNEQFVQKAPPHVVSQERDKLENAEERMKRILQSLQDLG